MSSHQTINDRKFHFLYRTTCLDSGNYYIGIHSTDRIDDGYLGSGKYLHRSVKKHGRKNHSRQILFFAESREAVALMEELVVDQHLLADPLCMNLKYGGEDGVIGYIATDEHKRKISIANKGKVRSEAVRKQISESLKNRPVSEETRRRISEAQKGKVIPEEQKQKMSAKKIGIPNLHSRRPIVIGGIEYDSIITASIELGINDRSISTRLRSKYFFNYYYKDSPKEAVKKISHNATTVIINGIKYDTQKEAALAIGITRGGIAKRCLSPNFPNYQFKKEDDDARQ